MVAGLSNEVSRGITVLVVICGWGTGRFWACLGYQAALTLAWDLPSRPITLGTRYPRFMYSLRVPLKIRSLSYSMAYSVWRMSRDLSRDFTFVALSLQRMKGFYCLVGASVVLGSTNGLGWVRSRAVPFAACRIAFYMSLVKGLYGSIPAGMTRVLASMGWTFLFDSFSLFAARIFARFLLRYSIFLDSSRRNSWGCSSSSWSHRGLRALLNTTRGTLNSWSWRAIQVSMIWVVVRSYTGKLVKDLGAILPSSFKSTGTGGAV